MSKYADRYTVYIDACCLAGALSRNILLSLAEAGLYRVQWSERVLDETREAIAKITKGHADKIKQIDAIKAAFPEAMVDNYFEFENLLISSNSMRDKDDAHVLAAAVISRSDVIVTDNLKDFPKETLTAYNMEALNSDDFISNTIDLDEKTAIAALKKMLDRFKRPELTWTELCEKAEAQGLTQTASMMQKYIKIYDK